MKSFAQPCGKRVRSRRPIMHDARLGRSLAVLCGAALVGGCSTISGWFPDKHKQYQYSTEIPPLEIPPDLTTSTIDGVNSNRRAAWESPASADESSGTPSESEREATPAPGAEMNPDAAQ